MSRRSDILTKIRDTILAVPGMHIERVKIGLIPLDKLGMDPVVLILPGADRGRLSDSQRTTRTFGVSTSVLIRIDPVKSDAQILQIENAYAAIHAALETLVLNACGGLAHRMNEGADGVSPGGFDDLDYVTYIGCDWELEYDRQLAIES